MLKTVVIVPYRGAFDGPDGAGNCFRAGGRPCMRHCITPR